VPSRRPVATCSRPSPGSSSSEPDAVGIWLRPQPTPVARGQRGGRSCCRSKAVDKVAHATTATVRVCMYQARVLRVVRSRDLLCFTSRKDLHSPYQTSHSTSRNLRLILTPEIMCVKRYDAMRRVNPCIDWKFAFRGRGLQRETQPIFLSGHTLPGQSDQCTAPTPA
jgi:hypothetical protein